MIEHNKSRVLVRIIDPTYMKPTVWNRIKVALWNFVLPPHIRLSLSDEQHPASSAPDGVKEKE